MLAQPKRRRLSIYTLPFVVLIGFLLVAKLAAWQRSDLIAELTDCVARGETREAIDAVHKLSALPNPPIPALVTAAAADEHETADAAQIAISRLLRRWQRDIEMKHRETAVANELNELAQSLAEQLNDFSDTDRPWLAVTAHKIVRMANQLPAAKTPLVAVHCDAIITRVGDGGLVAHPGSAPVASNSEAAANETTTRLPTIPPTTMTDRESPKANAKHGFSSVAPQRTINDGQANEYSNKNADSLPTTTERILNTHDDDTRAENENWPATEAPNGNSTDDELSQRTSSRPEPNPFSEWSQPAFRIPPTTTIGAPSVDHDVSARIVSKPPAASPKPGSAPADPLAGIESRELLRRWAAAEGVDNRPVERELAKRGFGKITTRMVRQFFSEDSEERMRLIDGVLAQPGAGSAAWLLLLANDGDAEVRLFAVTLMATSNDAALVEKAWQVSIRDRDPRIADLASRLRDRHSSTFRR